MLKTLRHVFEHKYLRRVLGANLAFMVVASPFLPTFSMEAGESTGNMVIMSPTTPLTTTKGLQYPLEKYILSQGYGFFHPALDMATAKGTPIKPIEAGQVETISTSKYAYGNIVIIDHGNGITSLYAHLSKIDVVEGEKVTTNTVIGEIGSTGRSTGNHLHLEVRDHGVPINPYTILPPRKV